MLRRDVGYFAGVDGTTSQLSLGRANSGTWTPLANTTVPGNVSLGSWYHVTLRVTGCTISATASWDQAVVSVTDTGCPSSGSAGIRMMLATGDVTGFAVTKGWSHLEGECRTAPAFPSIERN